MKGTMMSRKTILMLQVVFAVMFCVNFSSAAVLGTIDSDCEVVVSHQFPFKTVGLGYAERLPEGSGWYASVPLAWEIGLDDVGMSFVATTDTHGTFNDFTLLLTNGIDDLLIHSSLELDYESVLVNGIGNGVDLKGYTIESITMTVNEISVKPNQQHDIFYDWSYNITYTINGQMIPEPASLALLALGGGVLLRRRQ